MSGENDRHDGGTGHGYARLEEAIARHRSRSESLLVLALASTAAAMLEPRQAPFWIWCGAIAAAGVALFAGAAHGAARRLAESLDQILVDPGREASARALRRRARAICSPGHRRMLARRLEAVVARSSGRRRECYQTHLVRGHRSRLRRIARALARDGSLPPSAVAGVGQFLWDPRSPLLRRDADPVQFGAWLHRIELDLASSGPGRTPAASASTRPRDQRGARRERPGRGRPDAAATDARSVQLSPPTVR